ncbi:MAG: hypothetical protein JWR80_7063 [Bradyrhizobium sp.]|jgi:hypothetical protein|nr:hypothetical protein [Bradyrhizobium sp.]
MQRSKPLRRLMSTGVAFILTYATQLHCHLTSRLAGPIETLGQCLHRLANHWRNRTSNLGKTQDLHRTNCHGDPSFRHPADRSPFPYCGARDLLRQSTVARGSKRRISEPRNRDGRIGRNRVPRLSAAVGIEPGLRPWSRQNGNIRGDGRRLSLISAPTSANREARDESECAKSPDFPPILASLRKFGRMQKCLAGDAVLIAPVSTQNPC